MKTNRHSPSSIVTTWLAALVPLSTLHFQPACAQTADDFNPGANGAVISLAVQADGKILVGGSFTTLGGQTRNYIGRLNADGTLDSGFNPGVGGAVGGNNASVSSLAVQADGAILVGGVFTTLAGQTRKYIGRLNADGTLDSGFNAGAYGGFGVFSLALQADGKILLGGDFTTLGGQPRSFLGRLNADGTLDSGFNARADGEVFSLVVQADGKILVGGDFTTLDGQTRNNIGRLNADGTLDGAFNPGANATVACLALQADGKILVGGPFTALGGQPRDYLGRLNADGTLDNAFNPGAAGGDYPYVSSLAVQADGKILVGGWFSTMGGQPRSFLGRLNADGTLDTGFNPGVNFCVCSLAVQADGKILVCGSFNTLGGQPCTYIGRLNNTEPATQSLAYDGSTITWLRGGTSPEVWRTAFDYSTNGADWASLGAGARIAGLPAGQAGGWQLTSVSLPSTNGTIRARGYVTGGQYDGSAWFVENDLVLTYGPPVFISQPASGTNDPGTTAVFSALASGSVPLSYQWRKDGVPLADGGNIAGSASAVLVLTNVLGGNAGGYSAVVSNPYGSVTSAVALLNVNLATLDSAFNPEANGYGVYSLALQADGKILVCGGFGLGRLNADGIFDDAFNAAADDTVDLLAVQADGKILVAGSFTTLDGQPRNGFGRLNADATLDSAFNPWANAGVGSLAVQADGKLLLGGSFTTLDGQTRNGLGRLNADGTLDSAFNPGAAGVNSVALQADGKILVTGDFTVLDWQPGEYYGVSVFIERLNADGALDGGFNPVAWTYPAINVPAENLAVQADGKILVYGDFTRLGYWPCNYIGRLNADGTFDSGFNAGANGPVYSLAIQADGKILVGGQFTMLGGQPRNYLGRLNADGTLDNGFNPGAAGGNSPSVDLLAVQANGKILVSGSFTTLDGQPCSGLGRLNNTEPATQSLSFDGSTITWLRGGTSPEVWRTTFDYSTNGADWVNLGAGARIAGGWQLTGASLPSANGTIRARGYVTGGRYDGSAWFVESDLGLTYRPPVFIFQPASQTNDADTTVTFSVVASVSEPLSYQWRKDGVSLADGGNVVGSGTAVLTLRNVLGPDAGGYSVVVSNGFGSVTSAVATLAVRDPLIAVQPPSQLRELGQSVTFSVTAAGTAPFGYRWCHEGAALASATAASLTLTDLQAADAGDYWVVVSGPYGSATSAVALLTVNLVTLDSGFNPGPNDSSVNSLALQADGKILVGGSFTTLGGQARNYLGRLNADGTLDSGFNPRATGSVNSLAVQVDGKILVGGLFVNLGGQERDFLGRLNADGTLDSGFNPGATAINYPRVNSLAVQADGKILVGGYFTTLAGQPRNYLGRLNADGTLDSAFNPGALGWGEAPGVYCLAVQADGKILVGGWFANLAGQPRNCLARLNADGTLDSGFNPGAGYVNSLAVQADGKILVGGYFTTLAGQPRNYLGRLNSDGILDSAFNPGASDVVRSLAVQADGKILVGGVFSNLCGQPCINLGRLNNTEPATQSLGFDGATIAWLRGGASPEAWRTTFDFSTNGADWVNLGAGVRIAGLPAGQAGGWQLTSVSLPSATGAIRARGYVTGGQYNGSSWFVESDLQLPGVVGTPPVILVNDPSFGFSSNCFGFKFSGTAGQVVILETSTDLATWTSVGTNTIGATPVYFSDPYSGSFPRRFYRLQSTAP